MKLLPPSAVVCAAATAVLSLSGCNANPDTHSHDHWNIKGIAPRVQRSFLGYDAERNGRYVDYQYANKKSIYMTIMRHGLNTNPENPFQPENKEFYKPRPVHSIVPRPWEYINVEGLVFGGILVGTGAGFIPIPVDSVIGTMSEGGGDEFKEGIRQTVTLGQSSSSGSFLHESIGMEVKAAPLD